MGLLTALTSFASDLSQFYWFLAEFWNALPIVIRLLVYIAFGGALLIGIFRLML